MADCNARFVLPNEIEDGLEVERVGERREGWGDGRAGEDGYIQELVRGEPKIGKETRFVDESECRQAGPVYVGDEAVNGPDKRFV